MINGLPGKNKKKTFFFSSLQIWPLITCNKDILKTVTANSLKFGQRIEAEFHIFQIIWP